VIPKNVDGTVAQAVEPVFLFFSVYPSKKNARSNARRLFHVALVREPECGEIRYDKTEFWRAYL